MVTMPLVTELFFKTFCIAVLNVFLFIKFIVSIFNYTFFCIFYDGFQERKTIDFLILMVYNYCSNKFSKH